MRKSYERWTAQFADSQESVKCESDRYTYEAPRKNASGRSNLHPNRTSSSIFAHRGGALRRSCCNQQFNFLILLWDSRNAEFNNWSRRRPNTSGHSENKILRRFSESPRPQRLPESALLVPGPLWATCREHVQANKRDFRSSLKLMR